MGEKGGWSSVMTTITFGFASNEAVIRRKKSADLKKFIFKP